MNLRLPDGSLAIIVLSLALCASCGFDDEENRQRPSWTIVHPSGNDDGPIITQALVTGPVRLAAGEFVIRTPIQVPSGARLAAEPQTVIYSDLVGSGPGGYRQSTFFASAKKGEYESALLRDSVQGAKYIDTFLAPTPGMWIRISNSATRLVAQVFRVTSVEGTRAYLDRPIQYARTFRASSLVEEIDPPTNIRLLGHGARIVGTGDRAFELSATQSSLVAGWSVEGFFRSIVMSFDIGSADSVFRDVRIDGQMSAAAGIALESCYRCAIEGAHVTNTLRGSSNPGVYVVDSVDGTVSAVVENCGVGIQLASASPNDRISGGSRDIVVSGDYSRAEHYGALVTTSDIEFRGATFSSNRRIGINVDFGANRDRPSGGPIRLIDVKGERNAGPLLMLWGGSVIARRLESNDDGLEFQGRAIEIKQGTGTLNIADSTLTLTKDVSWYGVYTAGSGDISIESSRFALPGEAESPSAGIVVQGDSVTAVADTLIRGGRFGIYVYGNGATLSIDGDVQIDSAVPITVEDGSVVERL